MDTTRPLNKKEQRLFAKLYLGNIAFQSDNISHARGLSEAEAEGVGKILMEMGEKLLGDYDIQGGASQIIAQIKANRK